MNAGDFEPEAAGLVYAHENAWLKQQLAEKNILCEQCDSEEPLKVGVCLPCWNALVKRKVVVEQQLEAKLVVATGLLRRALQPTYMGTAVNDPTAAEIAVFLADPSQAAAQYREALAVVERVRDKSRFYLEGGFLENLQRELLGAQDIPTGGVADATALYRRTQEEKL